MTIRQTIHTIRDAVTSLYGECEAETIARMVVCDRLSYNFSQLVTHYEDECEIENLESIVKELQSGRPVQYVLGKSEFCDFVFEVAEGVLIPRPETEELVYRIAETTERGVRILDIGTGSGAIAISLAKLVNESEVVAIDISSEALKIARRNAEQLGANVKFVEADALKDLSALGKFPNYERLPYTHRNRLVRYPWTRSNGSGGWSNKEHLARPVYGNLCIN